MKFHINKSSIIKFIWCLIFVISCDQDGPTNGEENIIPEEAIPFDNLGSGKLVFHRTFTEYYGIYVIDLDDRSFSRIPEILFESPVISPDGEKIAFRSYAGSETAWDIFIMKIDGSEKQSLSKIKGNGERLPGWDLNSESVFYFVNIYPHSLLRQPAYPTIGQKVSVKRYSGFQTFDSRVDVSVNNRLVFVKRESGGTPKIYSIDISGLNELDIAPEQIGDNERIFSPSWSPDGERIAYISILMDSLDYPVSQEIVLIDADGSNRYSVAKFENFKRITIGNYFNDNAVSLCWSPDGSKIAFTLPNENAKFHVYAIQIDGSNFIQVTTADSAIDRSVSWSK